jgi:hypothetical protein
MSTTGVSDAERWTQTLVAGFGSMVVLRSSLLTVKVADESVSIGPAALLQIVLNSLDTAVDRLRGGSRATEAAELMANVSFQKAKVALPTLCIALLQNLPSAAQVELRRNVDLLAMSSMSDVAKSLALGCLLMDVAGAQLLAAAIKALGAEIR